MKDDKEEETALAIWRAELEYRRKKQWDIFAWTTTLLVASIGAVFALAVKGEFKAAWPSRAGFAIALILVAAYARQWIALNIRFEQIAREKLLDLFKPGQVKPLALPDPYQDVRLGYTAVILGLGAAAAITVLIPPCLLGISSSFVRPLS